MLQTEIIGNRHFREQYTGNGVVKYINKSFAGATNSVELRQGFECQALSLVFYQIDALYDYAFDQIKRNSGTYSPKMDNTLKFLGT